MALVTAEEGSTRLEALIAGLLFVSESDSPLRLVQFGPSPDLDALTLLHALDKPLATPITQQPLSALFDRTVRDQPWHGPREHATVERYRALASFLSSALDAVRVFRIGQIEVE